MVKLYRVLLALALGAPASGAVQAQGEGKLYAPRGGTADTVAPALQREFRAVWIATVSNIDWPSKPGLPVATQKAELLRMFDVAQRINLNAIVLQVRPGADALYASDIEPWSYFLTGAMGRAPAGGFDPLQFAVAEAHKRGMELHAWFNPYRALHPHDKSTQVTSSHVSKTIPGAVKRYGTHQWMDPGDARVKEQTIRVILDVIDRYDVDGVHMDDYFYPYPERSRGKEIPFPDAASWGAYQRGGGKLSRDDWRRKNVDDLIRELYDRVKDTKPWVKVGLSPFGIWRPGNPSVVRGFDAYDKLYADSRLWIRQGWVDYFTPQLYWKVTAPAQPYAALLEWWTQQNLMGRHMWPGNFTNRASARRTSWPVSEVFDQIAATRSQLQGGAGNVHFSMSAFIYSTDSLVQKLEAGPYAEPALVPASPWLSAGAPRAPQVSARWQGSALALSFDAEQRPPASGRSPRAAAESTIRTSSAPRWWLVRARTGDGWRAWVIDARNSTVRIQPPLGSADYVTVNSVDLTGSLSAPLLVSATAGSGPSRR